MKKRQKIKWVLMVGLISIPSAMIAGTKGVVTAPQLNVREMPSQNSKIVGQAFYGETLELIKRDQVDTSWYQVQLENDETAYVNDAFIKVQSLSGIVNEDRLNFRSYPSLTNSTIMAKLPLGTEVTVLYKVGDFYKILCQGNFGFVYAPYVNVPFAEYIDEQDITTVMDVGGLQVSMPYLQDMSTVSDVINEPTYVWSYTGAIDEQSMINSGMPISADEGQMIAEFAMQYIGGPYVFGGNDLLTGVDCSGFTQQIMKIFQLELPRTSRDQSRVGMMITDYEMLQPGDLLFFGDSEDAIGHVGIYIGDHCMVHASTPETGIIISNISERGFQTLQVARRMTR